LGLLDVGNTCAAVHGSIAGDGHQITVLNEAQVTQNALAAACENVVSITNNQGVVHAT
jgi:hypothetical protein